MHSNEIHQIPSCLSLHCSSAELVVFRTFSKSFAIHFGILLKPHVLFSIFIPFLILRLLFGFSLQVICFCLTFQFSKLSKKGMENGERHEMNVASYCHYRFVTLLLMKNLHRVGHLTCYFEIEIRFGRIVAVCSFFDLLSCLAISLSY